MSNVLQRNFFSSFLSVQNCLRYGSQYQSGNIWPKEIKSGGMIVWWMVCPYQLVIAIINSTESFPSNSLFWNKPQRKRSGGITIKPQALNMCSSHWLPQGQVLVLVKIKSLWMSMFYKLWRIFTYIISFNLDSSLFGYVVLIMVIVFVCVIKYVNKYIHLPTVNLLKL